MRKTLFLAAIALLLCFPEASRAEMASLFGIGPISSAMGGTALDQGTYNAYQVYSAPAALGYLRRVEVSIGAQYLDPHIRPFGTINLNSSGTQGDLNDSGVLPGGGSLLAFALPIGKTRPFTLGGLVYMPFTTLIRVSGTPVDLPFYPLYTDISRNFFFVIGAGYEFIDGWAFGVNVRSTTKSTAKYVLRTDNTVNYSATAVEAKSESRLSYSLLYDNERLHPENPWTLGAMYRNYAAMENRLMADVTAFVPVEGVLISMPAYTPAEWVLMGSMKHKNWLTTSAEISRVKWSNYVSPYGSGNINTYVIGNKQSEANFHDVNVLRFGIEEQFPQSGKIVRKLLYRQGYQYHPSPVPDQSGDSNFVDNDRHMFSLGFGLGLTNPWRDDDLIDVDFFFQYNSLKMRTISKNSTINVGAPGYETGGKILLYGFGASLRF